MHRAHAVINFRPVPHRLCLCCPCRDPAVALSQFQPHAAQHFPSAHLPQAHVLVVPAPTAALGLRLHAAQSLPAPAPPQLHAQPQPSTASSAGPAPDAVCKPVGRTVSRPSVGRAGQQRALCGPGSSGGDQRRPVHLVPHPLAARIHLLCACRLLVPLPSCSTHRPPCASASPRAQHGSVLAGVQRELQSVASAPPPATGPSSSAVSVPRRCLADFPC